jgi:hypothetical protein
VSDTELSCRDVLGALRSAAESGEKLDRARVGNTVNAKRGLWINFSYERLRQFGYRFESF